MRQSANFRIRPRRRWVLVLPVVAVLIYAVLLIPEPTRISAGAGRIPFEWKRDAFWKELEQRFAATRNAGCDGAAAKIARTLEGLRASNARLQESALEAGDALFATIETNLFESAPLVAACPARLPEFISTVTALRHAIKRQSQAWDLQDPKARHTLYRLLFGSRMTVEEVLLQASSSRAIPELTPGIEEPCDGPRVDVLGLSLRSGDILLSRGGAATSAMIARANDYPGSFSHAALLHVDEVTGQASIIESLSQRGVVVTPLDEFIKDKKLRIVVLRLRAGLPALQRDPLLPHRAAGWMLNEARRRHIPYDFSLDHRNHDSQFCSEVAAAAYEAHGIHLWPGLTYISMPAAIGWLGSLGVRHFETKEPADLEFDPQLHVAGEWRAGATLFKAHIDDAVTDVMLERAAGSPLGYHRLLLPVARAMKAWSVTLNWFGKEGPVPEGMSATAALRVDRYQKRHAAIAAHVAARAEQFRSAKGYLPPYWELVMLARQASANGQ
jgi:hypothetical protein